MPLIPVYLSHEHTPRKPAHSPPPRLSQIYIPKGSAYSLICLKLWPPLPPSPNLFYCVLWNPWSVIHQFSYIFSKHLFLSCPDGNLADFLEDYFSCSLFRFCIPHFGTTDFGDWRGCPSCSSCCFQATMFPLTKPLPVSSFELPDIRLWYPLSLLTLLALLLVLPTMQWRFSSLSSSLRPFRYHSRQFQYLHRWSTQPPAFQFHGPFNPMISTIILPWTILCCGFITPFRSFANLTNLAPTLYLPSKTLIYLKSSSLPPPTWTGLEKSIQWCSS